MKKNYLFSAIALCVCLLTACNKEIDTPQTESSEENKEGVITYIRATGNENASKGSIDGTSGNFSWNVGDQIAVWNTVGESAGYNVSAALTSEDFSGDNATFCFTDLGDRSNYAVSPAWIRVEGNPTSVNLPGTYDLTDIEDAKSPVPMIAVNSNEGTLHFKQLGALLRITLNNLPPSTRSVTIDFNGKKVQGTFAVSNPGTATPSIATEAASEGNDVITINIPAHEEEWLDNQVVNIPVPTGTYTKVTVTSYTEAGTATLTMTMPIKPGLNTTWKPIRTSARKMTASLPAFSVSDSKRVVIARSNLKCTTEDNWETWSWSFMENPWDIVETTNLAKANYEGATAIGLFCWGTSGHSAFSSDSHYGQYWQPYNTTNSKTDYGPIDNREGVIYNYKDLTDETYKYGDWGVEAGSIEGYSTWRTPTMNEYMYLFGLKNNNAKQYKYELDAALASSDSDPDYRYSRRVNNWGIGKVNGVIGMIIVPDHFVDPTGSFSFGYMQPKSSSAALPLSYNNTFSKEEWKPMEAAGAIFMPVAGIRSGTSFTNSRSARYWTSSMNNTIGNANANFECPQLGFNEYEYNLRVVTENRGTGRAVRLVRELE